LQKFGKVLERSKKKFESALIWRESAYANANCCLFAVKCYFLRAEQKFVSILGGKGGVKSIYQCSVAAVKNTLQFTEHFI